MPDHFRKESSFIKLKKIKFFEMANHVIDPFAIPDRGHILLYFNSADSLL
jgi:hypothetical protein